jgi:acyl carrier protein
MTPVRATIIEALGKAIAEARGAPAGALSDEAVLLETGLDSLGFAILITQLETTLGYDPFSLDAEAYYPVTLGDMIRYYERFAPATDAA